MKNPLRAMRFACAVVGLASCAAVGPAKGGFDQNHYILGCADFCAGIARPVVFGGSIDATFTGSWYDPAQSGQGLFLEVLPDHRVMAFWFTFDPAGTRQAWLVGTGTYTGNVATIDSVALPTGGRWIPNFDATKIVDNAWGSMTLTFDGYDRGKVEFKSMLGYGNGSMNLTRLTQPAGIMATAVSAPGQWVPAGNPNRARYGHTATLLKNGKVLVAGGTVVWYFATQTYEVLADAELFDPSSRTWTPVAPLSKPRYGHTATLLPDGNLLIAGGADSANAPSTRAELYDPGTDTWTSFDAPPLFGSATLLRTGKVLFVGSEDYGGGSRAVLFEPATRTWTSTGAVPDRLLVYHTATLLQDGKVLITGNDYVWGRRAVNPAYAEIYDPIANTWSLIGNLHLIRDGHTATLLTNGKVLVAGNWLSEAPTVAELYDPSTGQWSDTGNASVPRAYHTASLLANGKVLVAGGASGAYNSELYDPVTGSWSTTAPMIDNRESHTATVLPDGRVLVLGGQNGEIDALGNLNVRSAEIFGTDFPSGTIVPAMTGAWFDPAQRGHGLLLEVLPDAQLLAWWFAFNPAGTEQSWFGGLGSYSGNTATITAVDQTTGGRFIPNFDSSKIVNNAWGTLTFTFTDCDHGKVDFASTSAYGSGSMNLTRLTQPAGVVCP